MISFEEKENRRNSVFLTPEETLQKAEWMDIQKGGVAQPDGTISKDGKYIKVAGQWKWRNEGKSVKTQDLAPGQRYVKKDGQHEDHHVVDKVEGDTVHFSNYNTAGGGTTQSKMLKKDFTKKVAGHHLKSDKVEKKFNDNHFEPGQKELFEYIIKDPKRMYGKDRPMNGVHFATSHKVPKDLKWDSLPEYAKKELKEAVSKGIIKFDHDHITDDNKGLHNELFADELKKLPKIKEDDKGRTLILGEDHKYTPIKSIKGIYHNIKDLKQFAQLNPQVHVDERVLKVEPMQGGLGEKIYLGDYVKIKRWSQEKRNESHKTEEARLVKQLTHEKYGTGWQFKTQDGSTFNIWKQYWNPDVNFAGFGEKENDLIK